MRLAPRGGGRSPLCPRAAVANGEALRSPSSLRDAGPSWKASEQGLRGQRGAAATARAEGERPGTGSAPPTPGQGARLLRRGSAPAACFTHALLSFRKKSGEDAGGKQSEGAWAS